MDSLDEKHCRLCDALLPKCRERRLLSSDNSKQVVHKAAQLLSESVPGRMLYDADVEAYLKEPAAIDSQETAQHLSVRGEQMDSRAVRSQMEPEVNAVM